MSGRQNSSSPNSGSGQESRSQQRAPRPPQRLYNEGFLYSSSSRPGRGHTRQASSSSDDMPGLRYERPPPSAVPRTDEEIRADLFRLNGIPIGRHYAAESHRTPSFQAAGARGQTEQGPSRSQGRSSSSRSSSSTSSGRSGSRSGGPQAEHATPSRSVPSASSISVQGPSSRERSGGLVRGIVSQSQPQRRFPAHANGLFPRERGSTSARGSQDQGQLQSQSQAQSRGSTHAQDTGRQSRAVCEGSLSETRRSDPHARRQSRTVLEDALNDPNRRRVTRSQSRRARQGRDDLIRKLQQSSGTDRSSQSGSGASRGRGNDSGSGNSGSASGRGGIGRRR
ncbi:uncharacterized protein BDV14DRAFT_198291 [Aspergillus stella-maris]|uniref:uncharacterized protein n=1 Tax=Aspergillus stella-maris TaxID=1810926 RepID=UPI003CCCB0E0